MKIFRRRQLFLAIAAVGSAIVLNAIANPSFADSSLTTVVRRGHLRIGIDASVGGAYLFWNPKTQYYDGFEWDIIKAIAEKLKIEARPLSIPWNAQPASLAARQVDIILNAREQGSLDSGEYRGKFSETIPYFRSSQRLLVRKDAGKIAGLRDLIGKRVGVVANSGGAAVLETYNKNRGNAIHMFSSQNLDRLLGQMRDRQLDAMLLDAPIAAWHLRSNPNLSLVGDSLLPIDLVAIVNKDDESLKSAVDRALTQLRKEGKLESILRRWQLW